MSGNSQIEIELRGTLSKEDFKKVSLKLNQLTKKENDNKLTFFFVTQGIILKVTDEESKNDAKITVKVGDETMNILDEYEIPIGRESVKDAVDMFKHLGFDKVNPVKQLRTNYHYKNSDISLKFTNDWGYHFEIEKIITKSEDPQKARGYLAKICEELNLMPMTADQIRDKITEINKLHGFVK